ncbi:MAG: hypothetical protein NTW21_20210 [Verrucomicrobia bacterium]|nr:hypothetical protein [Verrucomicrobiota bacterium]
MELYETATGQTVSRQIPDPTVGQASLLAALGVELPEKAPPAGPVVVTRVESTLQVSKLINNPRVWKDR